MAVYFIQEGVRGAIKIGYTKNAKVRLATLQTGNPRKLKLLGYSDGDMALEASIHDEFVTERIRGEWFMPVPAIITMALMCHASRKAEGTLGKSLRHLAFRKGVPWEMVEAKEAVPA